MAPKGKGRGDDLKQEEILQAVVVADSFNVRFGPVTETKPKALLPLVDVPILDFTLDFLASQGVQETFIFCSHLSSVIRLHIKKSRWGENGNGGMTVKVILAEGSNSTGDALREIHSRSLIRNDFFLLNCDTITNVDLKELMQKHRDLRQKIKPAVMTMTCMRLKPQDRMRCTEDNVFLGVDKGTGQIYDYQRVTLDKKIKVPLKQHADMVLHQDLLDSQLYLCSPMVLHLFTDNFDYCTLEDFIRGIIINEEIFGNTVHVNVLKNKYCARITNPYMYDVISQDILSRKTQPISPQLIMASANQDVECQERNIYLGADVTLASTVDLKRNVVIGKGSSVQARAQIQDSIIGQNCSIGCDVKMQNCYLWGSVRVEEGCTLTNAILCEGVVVLANTTVQPHTILSWNVTVGPNITLPPSIRLQGTPPKDEFADDTEVTVPEVTPEFGAKSKAFVYTGLCDDEDSDDDNDQYTADWGEPLLASQTGNDDDDDDDDASSINPSDLENDLEEEEMDEYTNFYCELKDTLIRAKEENIILDNLILEVNSLKHACNIAIRDVHQAVVKALVDMPLGQHQQATGRELLTAVLRHVDSHRGLLKHYIKNREAQLDCLHSLEDFAVESEGMLSVLSQVVQYLYNKDVLEEQVIIRWYDTEAEEEEEEEHQKIRSQMQKFVTWLKEAEEESDDD